MGNGAGKEKKETKESKENTKKVPFKHWAKHNDEGTYRTILFLEKIEKRRSVFTSGKRCGDSDEALEEKIRNLGDELKENFLEDEMPGALKDIEKENIEALDTGKLEAFDEMVPICEKYLEEVKAANIDKIED